MSSPFGPGRVLKLKEMVVDLGLRLERCYFIICFYDFLAVKRNYDISCVAVLSLV